MCLPEDKRKPNQMSLDVALRVPAKERNIIFLFFLHELINLPKHVRISSLKKYGSASAVRSVLALAMPCGYPSFLVKLVKCAGCFGCFD